jgi:hypothetical protein
MKFTIEKIENKIENNIEKTITTYINTLKERVICTQYFIDGKLKTEWSDG